MYADNIGGGGTYVPSTIRGSSDKILKAFHQHINKNTEITIYSDWARKPGKNRKTDSQQTRFVVITTAALYVCKPGVITSVKISETYPWIAIRTINVNLDTHTINFLFTNIPSLAALPDDAQIKDGVDDVNIMPKSRRSSVNITTLGEGHLITLIIDNIVQFTEKCVSHLKSLLPLYYPLKLAIPQELLNSIKTTPSKPIQIVDLYVSQCIFLNDNADTADVTLMRQDIQRLKPFKIDRSVKKDNQVDAMCTALMYSPLIKKARIGGKNFNQLFSKLGHIISLNMGLQELEIFKYKISTSVKPQFDYFLRMLHRSSIKNLFFHDISIDSNNSELLIDNLSTLHLHSLCFKNSQFGRNILNQFYDFITNLNQSTVNAKTVKKKTKERKSSMPNFADFENESDTSKLSKSQSEQNLFAFSEIHDKFDMNEFAIEQDDLSNPFQVNQLITLCLFSSLTTLVLVDCQMDIQNFFESVSNAMHHCAQNNVNDPLRLVSIDLSKNKCSASFTGDYQLPVHIETLKIQKISWEGESLVTFLTKQQFMSWIDLDISKCDLNERQFTSLVFSQPGSLSVRSFIWDGNPLFVQFIRFLTEFKYLQILSINNCLILKKEKQTIIPALATLVSKTNLQSLSIDETFKSMKSQSITGLREVLCQHQTITKIDISDNEIGEAGLAVLKDIVTLNTRISRISFDGCGVDHYSSLVDFISYIAKLPYLTTIGQPKKEFKRLVEQYGKKVDKELNAAWSQVLEKHPEVLSIHGKKYATADSNSDVSCDDLLIDRTSADLSSTTSAFISSAANDSSTSNKADFEPQISKRAEIALLNTSWDIQFDLPIDDGSNEWDQLKNQYSFEKLTGLEALRPKSNDKDLIEFGPI